MTYKKLVDRALKNVSTLRKIDTLTIENKICETFSALTKKQLDTKTKGIDYNESIKLNIQLNGQGLVSALKRVDKNKIEDEIHRTFRKLTGRHNDVKIEKIHYNENNMMVRYQLEITEKGILDAEDIEKIKENSGNG